MTAQLVELARYTLALVRVVDAMLRYEIALGAGGADISELEGEIHAAEAELEKLAPPRIDDTLLRSFTS